jgi:ERCC4-type nuclease
MCPGLSARVRFTSSRSGIMAVESVKIAVDMREPEEIVSLLTELGVSVERKVFTPGDYVLSAEYAAERKTVADFMSSLFKGTLFEQLEMLKEGYPKPLLILEGDIATRLRGSKNPRSFWGGLLRIQVDMGVPVLPTPTLRHTAELLCTLAKRLQRRRVEDRGAAQAQADDGSGVASLRRGEPPEHRR